MDDVLPVRDTTFGSRRARVPVKARTGKFSPHRALLSTTGYIRSPPVDPAAAPGQGIAHHEGQVPAREGLDQVAERPATQGLVEGDEGGEGGDHHDLDPLVEALDVLERVEPAHAGQELDVEEHQVGPEARQLLDRRFAARHARDPVLAIEQGAQAHAHSLLVVHEEHARLLFGLDHGFAHRESSARGHQPGDGCNASASGNPLAKPLNSRACPLPDAHRAPESGQKLAARPSPDGGVARRGLRSPAQERGVPPPGRSRCAISLTRWLSRSAASSRSFWCRSFSPRSSLMLWRRCSAWRSEVSSRLRSCSFSYVTPRSRSFSRSDDSTRSRRRSCSCSSSRSEATWVCPASSQRRTSSPSRACLDSTLVIRTSPFV